MFEYYSGSGIPWITPTDIEEYRALKTAGKPTPKDQSVARIVPLNSILLACITSIGKNVVTIEKTYFFSFLFVIVDLF